MYFRIISDNISQMQNEGIQPLASRRYRDLHQVLPPATVAQRLGNLRNTLSKTGLTATSSVGRHLPPSNGLFLVQTTVPNLTVRTGRQSPSRLRPNPSCGCLRVSSPPPTPSPCKRRPLLNGSSNLSQHIHTDLLLLRLQETQLTSTS